MRCPKCGAPVGEQAVECSQCGIVLAKAGEAMDRAFLRRQSMARQRAVQPVEEKKSPLKTIIVVALLALCGFGAWQWYTDDHNSDFDKLAAEVRQSDGTAEPIGDGRVERRMLRLVLKLGIAVAVFALGWMRLKQSMSP